MKQVCKAPARERLLTIRLCMGLIPATLVVLGLLGMRAGRSEGCICSGHTMGQPDENSRWVQPARHSCLIGGQTLSAIARGPDQFSRPL